MAYAPQVISSAGWLKVHAPAFIPFVNQVANGPQTLYRTGLFVNAPEQYPIKCFNGSCTKVNATVGAIAQDNLNALNALHTKRYGLHSWPLFHVGCGNGPFNSSNPDNATDSVRSDSLVRFMIYSAVAYGAKALNFYCWGGGVYWYNTDDPCATDRPTACPNAPCPTLPYLTSPCLIVACVTSSLCVPPPALAQV